MYDAGALVFNIRAAGVQVFEDQVKKADRAVDGLGSTTQKTADKTEQLGKRQDRTTEQTRKHQKAQEDAARAAKEYGDAQEKVGKVFVTAGAAIVATTALTVNSAIQWESAWAGVTKTVDGLPEELAEVESGLRGLTDVLPAGHTEIAAVAEAAGQLGVQTDNVVAFTKTMIDLGETTNLSANDAATSLARFMNVMGTSQDQVSNLGSAVVDLGNNYATTEAEIVEMASRLSGAARQVGLTEGETVGLATALSAVGIEAEAGGSAVSKVMIDIAASVEEGGDRLSQFAEIAGVSADEFAQKWRTDPGAALAVFVKGLADAEQQGGSTLGMLADLEITEVRMRDALLRSAAASDDFTAAMAQGNEAFEENNALQAEAAKRYATVESQLGIMRNRVNDAAIDLGSVFLPVVADVAEGIGDFADGLASLPQPLRDAVAEGGLAVGMIALMGGTALIAVPKIVEFVGTLRTVATANSTMSRGLRGTAAFLTSPWGVAFVAAAAGAVLLKKHLDDLTATSEEMDNAIRTAADGATVLATAAPSEFTALDGILSNTKDQLKDLDQTLIDLENFHGNIWERGPWNLSRNAGLAGPEDALKRLGEQLATIADTDLPAAQRGFQLIAEETDGSDASLRRLLDRMPEFQQALVDQATDMGINVSAMSDAERSQTLLTIAMEESEDQSQSAARAYVEAADGADTLRKDLEQLLDVLNEQNEIGQDAISANIDYQNTLREVDEQIRKAKEGAEGYALGLDITTQAGADNKQMLVDLAQGAWEAAAAQHAVDGDTDAYRQTLEDSRAALLERIEDFGVTGQAAQDLADDILQIPSETEWKMIAETANAEAKLATLKAKLDAIPNVTYKRVQLDSFTVGNFDVSIPNADGNVIEAYANGGIREHHIAQIARGGATRIWNEPETEGETYVPHAKSKRARSEQIMAETASIFGGTYIPAGARGFADGAVVGGGGGTPEIRVVVQSKGGIDLLQYIDVKVEQGSNKLTNALRGG